jgi:pyruvate dehydrogenase E2 component (dihydrolipoamide acetyltransferase)
MAVVKEFTLPDLGEGLTEAEIVRWLVEVGEVVAVDQPVVEVETAKAVVEVPCPYGGVVTARFGEEGDTLAVGRPLVTVAVGSGDGTRTADEGSGNVLVGYGTGPATTRRRARVRAVGAAVAHTADAADAGSADAGTADAGSADAATVTTRTDSTRRDSTSAADAQVGDAHAAHAATATAAVDGSVAAAPAVAAGPVAVISPLVRRIAREHGLDLRALTGSGPDGLILRTDVERAISGAATAARQETAAPAAARTPAPAPTAAATGGEERIPLRGIRGAVAEKLARSRREIPDATCWVDADATELLAVRAAMNAAGRAANAEPISVAALFARIVTAALARHPELNATVDTERGEIVRLPAVHLGFAAQTDRGLVVPVVRDAHTRTTAGLSAELRRLTEAARAGTLTPAELTGGTFTLNNYGVFGVDGSTPILNHPEAAMLGVGRIAPKPWVHEGELAVRQVVQLSFTFDHRVCDGGTAGGFLRFVADCVENPAVLLATV